MLRIREMLPAYIIEKLFKQRQREKQSSEELFIECPNVDEREPNRPDHSDGEGVSDRGIAIIDFTI